MTDYTAPRPWIVEKFPNHRHWTNSVSIFDARGEEVAVLTRGYEGDVNGDDCPSFQNAQLIVDAVNAFSLSTEQDYKNADAYKAAIQRRIKVGKGEVLVCPRAKSDMTPCVARDGRLALAENTFVSICVGCEWKLSTLIEKEKQHGQAGSRRPPLPAPR